MLYLVITEVMDSYPLPPSQWLELVEKNLEDILKYKEQGKIIVHGGYVGRQAGCIIWNVDSNEELQRLITQLPLWPFMEWEIIPLISTETALESVKQGIESLNATK